MAVRSSKIGQIIIRGKSAKPQQLLCIQVDFHWLKTQPCSAWMRHKGNPGITRRAGVSEDSGNFWCSP